MILSRLKALLIISLASLFLTACSLHTRRDGPPRQYVDVSRIPNATPKYEPKSRYGNPRSYVALGKRYYVLRSARGYNERGIASWYGRKFHGRLTSSREPYNMLAMTAASPTLPLPTYVRVTNLQNHRSVIVKVNDRGPFAPNRIIDLSYAAAKKLGYTRRGTALVQVTALNLRNPKAMPAVIYSRKPQLYLQVGAFSQLANAEQLKRRLETYTNKRITITKVRRYLMPVYRVRIGPLVGVGESDALFNQLNRHGLSKAMTVIA